jgi:hypothetical protein
LSAPAQLVAAASGEIPALKSPLAQLRYEPESGELLPKIVIAWLGRLIPINPETVSPATAKRITLALFVCDICRLLLVFVSIIFLEKLI